MGKFSVERLRGSGGYQALAKQAGRARRLAAAERYARARSAPIRTGTVLYESFSGNGMLCNPEAIFRHLLADPDYRHLRHIWALSSLEAHPDTVAEFAGHPRVSWLLLFLHAVHGTPMIQPSHFVRRLLHRSQAVPLLRPAVDGRLDVSRCPLRGSMLMGGGGCSPDQTCIMGANPGPRGRNEMRWMPWRSTDEQEIPAGLPRERTWHIISVIGPA